jgi:hypothetical protein
MTTLQEPEYVTMTSFLPYYGENPKEAAKQAKLQAREQAKQAKVQEKEAAKQAKLQEKEAAKQAKVQEKEAAKQAKLQEKEAAKQAKMLAKVQERDQARAQAKQAKLQEREALKKRKERVKEIKRQQRQQIIITEHNFRLYRAREREIVRARIAAAERERENEERRAREAAAALVARENTNRARIEREERHMRRLRSIALGADLTDSPRTVIVLEDRERTGGLPERLVGRNRDRRREYQQRGAVNPMQELINQDQTECNKTREELTLAENAFEVTDCPVCFDELGNTNQMTLRCGHKFCGDCIMEHMQRVGGMKCPICREQYGVRIDGWAPPIPRR